MGFQRCRWSLALQLVRPPWWPWWKKLQYSKRNWSKLTVQTSHSPIYLQNEFPFNILVLLLSASVWSGVQCPAIRSKGPCPAPAGRPRGEHPVVRERRWFVWAAKAHPSQMGHQAVLHHHPWYDWYVFGDLLSSCSRNAWWWNLSEECCSKSRWVFVGKDFNTRLAIGLDLVDMEWSKRKWGIRRSFPEFAHKPHWILSASWSAKGS